MLTWGMRNGFENRMFLSKALVEPMNYMSSILWVLYQNAVETTNKGGGVCDSATEFYNRNIVKMRCSD